VRVRITPCCYAFGMRFDLANLPTDTATLHQIIAAQVAEGAAREAELAAAKAGLMAKALEVEKLKLQLARLRRMQFGRSSEKIARSIELLGAAPGRAGGRDPGAGRRGDRTGQACNRRRADLALEAPEVATPGLAGAPAAPRDHARAELHLPKLRRRDAQGR